MSIAMRRWRPGHVKKLEFKNCDLKGAKNVWWANSFGGWRPGVALGCGVHGLAWAVPDGHGHRIRDPDLAQMTGTRFGYSRSRVS